MRGRRKIALRTRVEHSMDLKMKKTWGNLLVMISIRQNKGVKGKLYFCFFPL